MNKKKTPKDLDNELQDYSDSSQPAEEIESAEALSPIDDQETSDDANHQEGEISNEELRQQLVRELEQLIQRLKEIAPDYSPPPFSPQGLVDMMGRNLGRFSPQIGPGILEKLRSGIGEDLFDIDTWKGIWYMVNFTIEYQVDILKRRTTGDYETDEWGFDQEVFDALLPFFDFMYKRYFRVEVTGIENIPDEGRALLVCNHSGQLPWDGSMVGAAVYNEHPDQRLVRTLYAAWFPTLPFLSDVSVKMGQVLANEENGIRLLEQEELVAVFPEGHKGIGKLYRDRYRLARFGRGGFVRMALKTNASIIPVSVVGAEETYISVSKAPMIAKMIGSPYFPISLRFPWLGPLGVIPLPTKWFIDFGEPIPLDGYDPDAASDLMLVSQLTDQVRNTVQNMIYNRLAQRKSVFFG